MLTERPEIFLHAESGNYDALVASIEAGADPMERSPGGWTLLMLSAADGHSRCVEFLIPLSDTAATDKEGNTAFYIACAFGHAECVRLLLGWPGWNIINPQWGDDGMDWAIREGHGNVIACIESFMLHAEVEECQFEIFPQATEPARRANRM